MNESKYNFIKYIVGTHIIYYNIAHVITVTLYLYQLIANR